MAGGLPEHLVKGFNARQPLRDSEKGGKLDTQDLRKAGLKVTLPRMRILEILENASGKHLTAEEIFKDLLDNNEEIGLATVYRVLMQFEAAGIVVKHNFEGGQAVFELDRGEHHDHMFD